MNFLHLIQSGCRKTIWFACGTTMIMVAYPFPKANHPLLKLALLGAMFSLGCYGDKEVIVEDAHDATKIKIKNRCGKRSTLKFGRVDVWKMKVTVKPFSQLCNEIETILGIVNFKFGIGDLG